MRRFGALLLCSTGLLIGAHAGGAAGPTHTIDQSVLAGAQVGLHRGAYDALFGTRAATTRFPGGAVRLAYLGGKLQVFLRGDVGTAILTVSNEYRTPEGIGPCSTAAKLVSRYGLKLTPYRAAHTQVVIAYRLGHLVFAVPGGKVTAVMLTDNGSRDLPLALNAAGCGGGEEE